MLLGNRPFSRSAAIAAALLATTTAGWAGVSGAGSNVNINVTTTQVNQTQVNEVVQDIVLESLWRLVGHTERLTPKEKQIPPKHWDLELVVSDPEFASALAGLKAELYDLATVPGRRSSYTVLQDEQTGSERELISQTFETTDAGQQETYSETVDAGGAQFGVDYIGDPDNYLTWIAIGDSDVNVTVDGVTTTTNFVDQITTNAYSQVAVWQVSSSYTVTPLLLDLDGDGAIEASGGQWLPHSGKSKSKLAFYDFHGDGFPVLMEWPGAQDGILCEPGPEGQLDGTRLFGTARGFKDGYEALRVKDANNDSVVDGQELDGLAVWIDANGDARPQDGEVRSLAQHRVSSLSLKHKDYVASFTQDGKRKRMFDWWPQVYELQRVRLAPKST
jgi:hypothetical protein